MWERLTLPPVADSVPSPLWRMLKIVKKDEFSTKCNQTDHHRMSGGRQEVSLYPSVRRARA